VAHLPTLVSDFAPCDRARELPSLSRPPEVFETDDQSGNSRESGGRETSPSSMTKPSPPILDSFDLAAAERLLCAQALELTGSLVEAARLLGCTRHALKRRMIKHRIDWRPRSSQAVRHVNT
jgi:DNA-binding NtrC family response regulator